MPNRYLAGDVVHITGTFTDPQNANAPIDPTTVTLRVWTRGTTGNTYTYGVDNEVTKLEVGTYAADIDTTDNPGLPGGSTTWNYEWSSTGVGQAADAETFTVTNPPT